jgi:hypothetical protein
MALFSILSASDCNESSFRISSNSNPFLACSLNEASSKAQFEPDMANNINNIKKDNLQLNASTFAAVHNTDLLAQQMKNLLG